MVIVGKIGWKTGALIERIRAHPDLGTRIHWYDRLDDPSLDGLYGAAHCVVMPSFYEGFGLPIIEALSRGVPTLSSNGGALPEAGGDLVDYFDPTSAGELAGLLRRQLMDADFHAGRRARLAEYRAPTWSDGAAMVLDVHRAGGPARTRALRRRFVRVQRRRRRPPAISAAPKVMSATPPSSRRRPFVPVTASGRLAVRLST